MVDQQVAVHVGREIHEERVVEAVGKNESAVVVFTSDGGARMLSEALKAGVKGYEFSTWYGLLVPAGTPKAVVERLNAETRKALSSASVKEQFATQGLEPTPSTSQEFTRYLRSEVVKWAKVIRAAGATPN